MQDKATQRKTDLDDSLQAQQYFADANEAESWMKEKEPIVENPDYGKDEDSAEVGFRYFILSLSGQIFCMQPEKLRISR